MAFEAQLFCRTGRALIKGHHMVRIHHQDIKSVLERALAAPTDADDVVERDGASQKVNLLAYYADHFPENRNPIK